MDANTWQPAASGSIPAMGWITGSGNVSYLNTNDPTTAKFFFDTPNSFCTGVSLTHSPAPSGYALTPILSVDSYTNPASDTGDPGLVGDGTSGPGGGLLPTGAITYPYQWIMYDIEGWAATPTVEQDDPPTYMQNFINACHTNIPRYKAIMAPGYDLYSAAALANYPLLPGEQRWQWFVRVIVAMGGAGCDLFVLQQESQQGSPIFAELFNAAAGTLASISPSTLVYGEVSSSNATGSTQQELGASMVTDAVTLTSPYPDGFYAAMPSPNQAAGRYFLDDMMAAGYSA